MKITEKSLIKAGWNSESGAYEKFNSKNTVGIQVAVADNRPLFVQVIYKPYDEWLVSMPRPTVHDMSELQSLCKLYLQDKVI